MKIKFSLLKLLKKNQIKIIKNTQKNSEKNAGTREKASGLGPGFAAPFVRCSEIQNSKKIPGSSCRCGYDGLGRRWRSLRELCQMRCSVLQVTGHMNT